MVVPERQPAAAGPGDARRTSPLFRIGLFALVAAVSPAASAPDELRHLLLLRHERAPARYAAGALDRAARVQERFALLAEDVARWANAPQSAIGLMVIPPEDWRRAGATAEYGVPQIGAQGELLLPAWGGDGTVALWRRLLGRPELPWPGGVPVRGTAQEAASLALADLVGQLEASRALLGVAGLGASTPELRDVFAALLARAAFERHESVRQEEVESVFARLALAPERELSRWGVAYGVAAAAGGDKAQKAFRLAVRSARRTEGRLLLGDFARRFPQARTAWDRAYSAVPAAGTVGDGGSSQ